LTLLSEKNIIPQDQLKLGGIIMKGLILCNRCRKKMDGVCKCGNYKCLVQVYWKGKYYEFRRDDQGYVFTYDKAMARLMEINNLMQKGSFSPSDFNDTKINERKFENQIEKWLNEKENRERLNELSYGTLRDYRGYVKNYFCYFHGLDVREIALEKLTEFRDILDKVSIKTRKNILNALRNFFYCLKERGVISDVPLFPKIKGDDSKTRTSIDVELQEEVLIKMPVHHNDIMEFLMETGIRPGEGCAILCEHIDLRKKTLKIERTFSSNRLRETTKQKRKREVPLSNRAYEIAERNMTGK